MTVSSAKHLEHRNHCIEMVEKNLLLARARASLLSHARLFAAKTQIIPQAQASIEETKRLIVEAEQLPNRR